MFYGKYSKPFWKYSKYFKNPYSKYFKKPWYGI